MTGRRLTSERVVAELETLDRVAAVAVIADAVRCGAWPPDPAVLRELGGLVDAARRWAERAEAA